MKILTGEDIRQADLHTIENEPVSSLDLMERAAAALAEEIITEDSIECAYICEGRKTSRACQCAEADAVPDYVIFVGKGNNGGDGLAVARLLARKYGTSRRVSVVTVGYESRLSEECRANLERLPSSVRKYVFHEGKVLGSYGGLFNRNTVIIDAMLGTGVRGAVKEPVSSAVRLVNSVSSLCRKVISIDMPSGMPTEPEDGHPCDFVAADRTIAIEFPKLSLLLPESGKYAGRLSVVHIGLDRDFIKEAVSGYEAVDADMIRFLLKPRNEFDNKGTHGHALVIAGSCGMMGAAVLSTGAALKSGCGLVTVRIPGQERQVIHITHPSAIVLCDPSSVFSSLPDNLSRYSSVAAGPGLGQKHESVQALGALLDFFSGGNCRTFARTGAFEPHIKTLVLDADALNMISAHPDMFRKIPAGAVLTPHIGELARLLRSALASGFISAGDVTESIPADAAVHVRHDIPGSLYPWHNDMHKIMLVRALSRKLSSVIVVKGAHTMICIPDGKCFFNMTGNPGMAKGGSGDILTGLIAGLAARGYDSIASAILGVWLHGRAGDRAASEKGMESMNASDILDFIRIM